MTEPRMQAVHVIGGGLAGSEAAWQIASAGVPVVLHEMRPTRATEAHRTDGLAELVCSNSLRSDDRETRQGKSSNNGGGGTRKSGSRSSSGKRGN